MDAHELHIQLDPAKRASDDIYEQLRALITSGALKPGDRICTIGGIYGTIKSIKDDTIELSVGREDTKMIVARWAIRNVEEVTVENDGELLN